MLLIRLITLECMIDNIRLYAKHVRTDLHGRADALSRGQIQRFKNICTEEKVRCDTYPIPLPEVLCDINRFWIR